MSSSVSTLCECPCIQRRRIESRLPLKRTTIFVGYLISFVLGALALIMLGINLHLEDRPDFYSALASWGIESKRLVYLLFLLSMITIVIDKLQQFWVELEVTSKAHLFGTKSSTFSRNTALTQPSNL